MWKKNGKTKGKLKKNKKTQKELQKQHSYVLLMSCCVVSRPLQLLSVWSHHFSFFQSKKYPAEYSQYLKPEQKKTNAQPKKIKIRNRIEVILRFKEKNLDDFCREQEKTCAEFSPLVSRLYDQYKGMFPK